MKYTTLSSDQARKKLYSGDKRLNGTLGVYSTEKVLYKARNGN